MAAQDFTVKSFTNKNKPDKFGNHTYTVVFEEDARPVYLASKTEIQAGMKKFGEILDGEYGPRFKSQQKEGFAPPQGTGYQPQSRPNKKSDDERSDDIRWGLCIKEANAYVTKYRVDLDADKWASEVNEYANALYKLSAAPTEPEQEEPTQDQLPDDMLDGTEPIEVKDFPF